MADPSKSEAATPRRKEEARRKGQVPRSTELNTALGILGTLLIFQAAGAHMLEQLGRACVAAWSGLGRPELTVGDLDQDSLAFGFLLLKVMGPLLLGVALVGVLSNVLQFGFLFAPEAMALKPENLSPARGFERIASRRTAVELAKNLLKLLLVGLVAWGALSGSLDRLLSLMATDLALFWPAIGAVAAKLFLRVGLTLLALAVLDAWYQRWEYEEGLKMSKQEVKDEARQLEGDPLVKARIRRLQQEASRRRMFAELPSADVVITNPVHLAVALRYDAVSMDAPVLVAKGARLVAARIKVLAREHGIPVVENKPLARALFPTPLGAAVPSPLFSAIAETLAFVYQMKGTLEVKARLNQERLLRRSPALAAELPALGT